MPDNNKNKKKLKKDDSDMSLAYEAVKAYNVTGDNADPLGSYTGVARTGEAGPDITAQMNVINGEIPGGTGYMPPRNQLPRGSGKLPGDIGLPGIPFPISEPVQPGIPGGKTYLNVKDPESTSPTQDADDL